MAQIIWLLWFGARNNWECRKFTVDILPCEYSTYNLFWLECVYTDHNLLVVTLHKSASWNEDLWSLPNYVIKCNFQRRETQEINTWNWWCLLIIFILQKYYCYSEIVVRTVSVSDVYSAFIYIQSLTLIFLINHYILIHTNIHDVTYHIISTDKM